MKATTNTPNFKSIFAIAKVSENSVMECNQMDDYFHMTTLEIHCHLNDFAEFAVRSMKAGDLVALEEVETHTANLTALLLSMKQRVHNMRTALLVTIDAQNALALAEAQMSHKSDSLGELFECELGMEIDETE